MASPKVSLSRLTILGCALGGTAIQALEKLGPVAEAATAGVCPWLGPLVVVAGATAGLGFGRIGSALDKRKELQDATRELLTNRDIALAQARAVQARLRNYGNQLGDGAMAGETKRLLALADAAEEWWVGAVSDPARDELATVRDDQIVAQLTPYLSGEDHLILEAETWKDLLLSADQRTKGEPKLSDAMAGYFAGHLAGDFTHDFVEALKTDLETGGKAYAAVSLRFFGEILSGVRGVAQAQTELKPLLEQLPQLLLQVQDAVAALRTSGLPSGLDTALAATEGRLRKEMGDVLAGIERLLEGAAVQREETKAIRDELKAVRDLLAQALARPLKAVFEFRTDISRILKYAPAELIGREAETQLLHDAWAAGGADLPVSPDLGAAQQRRPTRVNVLTFVALGGEGKTSLVAKWAAELAAQDWPGCDAVFAWSFYSQGTREQTAVSSDLFLAEALTFFGDEAMAKSPAGAHEKGTRLAKIVGQRRSLLILDGLEPLQYAPTSPTPGELKDQGLGALLKRLAATSHGLCVVTTRYALPDLRAFLGRTVREEKLARLSRAAGVQLLKAHGITGSDRRNLPLLDGDAKSEPVSEFEKLVEDVDGHALTLHIMGSFLKKAFGGDIRKRDRVTFAKASQKTDNDHAFRAMAAYARWMEDGSDEARRELAILRLMGLFDRPGTADCLAALLAAPAIPGLTEPLTGLPEEDWNCSLESLVAAKLLTVSPETVSVPACAFPLPASLDAHPLIREYFAQKLKDEGGRTNAGPNPSTFNLQPSTFQQAHRRLYEHLCASTQEGDQPTLEDLQPLYQAVAHGCQAGLQQEAAEKVYQNRIQKREERYSTFKLGALGSDLGAVACFFELPWSRLSPALSEARQAWLLNEAAFRLRALGRLTEALEPMRAGLEGRIKLEQWKDAAISASNLSELELTLGEVAGAVGDAEQSVTYADRSGDAFLRMGLRTTHADALHQAGRRAESEARFREAEQMQAERQPDYPLLYSVQGFRYCDLLLAEAERAAWQLVLGSAPASGAVWRALAPNPERVTSTVAPGVTPVGADGEGAVGSARGGRAPLIESCRAVSERGAKMFEWRLPGDSLLDIALDHLTLGRAALYAAILENFDLRLLTSDLSHIDAAVSSLRRSGRSDILPLALLTRAWQRSLTGARTGSESAQSDLDEAWEIAERGPMPLFLADIHLYRARLFGGQRTEDGGQNYPWESPQKDLAEARRLIVKHGYLRRLPELEDAEAVLGG